MRQRAVVVPNKAQRVMNFHHETIASLSEMLAAAGLSDPKMLGPHHIFRRVGDGRILTLADQFEFLPPGALLGKSIPAGFAGDWARAGAAQF